MSVNVVLQFFTVFLNLNFIYMLKVDKITCFFDPSRYSENLKKFTKNLLQPWKSK